MTISIQAVELQRIIALQPIRQNLIFAQQRLQDRHIPFQIAALTYLRITCSAMRTYQRLGLDVVPPSHTKTPYLSLLNQLTEQRSDWWQSCWVSDSGYLTSNDRYIQDLLQPLNMFVEQVLTAP